jgi:hypothetical protein
MLPTSTATALLDEPVARTRDPQQHSGEAADNDAIRPFHVNVPEAELAELRRRINATEPPNQVEADF